MKKLLFGLLTIMAVITLTGCGNYLEINRLDIVTGIAIDKSDGEYKLTFEIFNVAKADSEGTVDTTYTESTGKTIFEAIRNAKKQLVNSLFFGTAQALIISRQLAETEGILPVIEGFIRDGEPRETMVITISQEETAVEVLKSESPDSAVLSFAVRKVVLDDVKLTGATNGLEMYKAYTEIREPGVTLALPLLKTFGEDKKKLEVAGIAVFENDKMQNEISSENAKYFLMLADNLDGGVINFKTTEDGMFDSSAEIMESRTSFKYSERGGILKFELSVFVKIDVIEYPSDKNLLEEQARREIETKVERIMREGAEELLDTAKKDFGREIFGWGRKLYKTDKKLWNKYKENWDESFLNSEIEIEITVKINNTGFLRKF